MAWHVQVVRFPVNKTRLLEVSVLKPHSWHCVNIIFQYRLISLTKMFQLQFQFPVEAKCEGQTEAGALFLQDHKKTLTY